MSRSITKNVSGKYSKKLPDHVNKFLPDGLKTTSKRVIQKSFVIKFQIKLQRIIQRLLHKKNKNQ